LFLIWFKDESLALIFDPGIEPFDSLKNSAVNSGAA
jgi:hypothetical protein